MSQQLRLQEKELERQMGNSFDAIRRQQLIETQTAKQQMKMERLNELAACREKNR